MCLTHDDEPFAEKLLLHSFDTRNKALEEAYRVLTPGGTLGLTDLVLPSRDLAIWERVALGFICSLAGLPVSNLVTEQAYTLELERQGWQDIVLQDISANVFPGFLAFMERHGDRMGRALVAWPGLVSYAKVLRWYSNPARPRLRFYLISATKR